MGVIIFNKPLLAELHRPGYKKLKVRFFVTHFTEQKKTEKDRKMNQTPRGQVNPFVMIALILSVLGLIVWAAVYTRIKSFS